MFTVRHSPTPLLSGRKTEESKSSAPVSAALGTDSMRKSQQEFAKKLESGEYKFVNTPEGEFISTSSGQLISTSDVSMRVTGAPNTGISGNAITIDVDPMLTGLTPQTEHVLHRVYKDIYYNDAVGGGSVDLMSMIPFSDFSLGGLTMKNSDKARDKYMETLSRLNTRSLLPAISTDYLVLGSHCSSLLYNRERRVFTDLMPHQPENLKVEPLPFYGQDPLLTVTFPPEVVEIIGRQGSKRIERLRETIGKGLVEQIMKGSLELDPLSTLFITRRTFSRNDKGTSFFRRILPIYLIEKNLFRGTLVESAKRQRGILHAQLGDGEEWIPTNQDFEFITELLMNADSDPIGAIIATRSGIQIDEIRQGGEFWKITDFSDSVLSTKLRAMGMSEAFLSGESSWNTSDNSMVVFLDMIRSYREYITYSLFYNKLFPLISLINGYTLKGDSIRIDDGLINRIDSEEAMFHLNDGSKLLIPTVQWTKQLKPEGDSTYLDMLNGMTEKGVPVSLRALAAAGGIDIEQLLKQQDEDIELRKKVAKYSEKIAALAPQPAEGEEGGMSESSAASALNYAMAASKSGHHSASAVLAERGGKPVPFLSRDFSSVEPYTLSRTGKRKPVLSASRSNYERAQNANIIRSLKEVQRKRGER